jgi:hypothetical protein
MNISELLQGGISRELQKRGIHGADIVASGLAEKAKLNGSDLTIDDMPIDQYLDKYCQPAAQEQEQPGWTPPEIEEALKNPAVFDSWLQEDPDGLKAEFERYASTLK